jgi:hypothetical protein
VGRPPPLPRTVVPKFGSLRKPLNPFWKLGISHNRLIGGGGSIMATPLLLYVDDGVEEVR